MEAEQIELTLGDVYKFEYSEEHRRKHEGHDLNWCFDGQLEVVSGPRGFLLRDTYWNSEARQFTLEQALSQGVLTLICNLDDIEKISEHDWPFFDPSDVFDLSHQHRCYRALYKRKGAGRSKQQMLSYANQKIAETESEIESGQRRVQWLTEAKAKIEAGNLEAL